MKIIVIGSGNWGTTLAMCFCKKHPVHLWTMTEEEASEMTEKRENIGHLPGIKLPDSLIIEKKYTSRIDEDDIIITVVPSRVLENVFQELYDNGVRTNIIVNASKGVKHSTIKTAHQIARDILPEAGFAAISGPNIAVEIAHGLPAKTVLVCYDVGVLVKLQEALTNDLLFFEFSRDISGIELCAALKGLIAIAVGFADGLGYKTNIFGLIITKGLQEFKTVVEFLGVSIDTVYGIAGVGDLVTTCLSEDSRNRRFGKYLAQGFSTDDALKKVGMEVEGVSMAKTVRKFAKFNLNIPLISMVAKIIFEGSDNVEEEFKDTLLR